MKEPLLERSYWKVIHLLDTRNLQSIGHSLEFRSVSARSPRRWGWGWNFATFVQQTLHAALVHHCGGATGLQGLLGVFSGYRESIQTGRIEEDPELWLGGVILHGDYVMQRTEVTFCPEPDLLDKERLECAANLMSTCQRGYLLESAFSLK